MQAAKEILAQINGIGVDVFSMRDYMIELGASVFDYTKGKVTGKLTADLKGIPQKIPSLMSKFDDIVNDKDGSESFSEKVTKCIKLLAYSETSNILAYELSAHCDIQIVNEDSSYCSFTNEGVYRFNVLRLYREDSEKIWNNAWPFRSNDLNLKNKYSDNITKLSKLKDTLNYTTYDFTSSVKQQMLIFTL